MKWPDDLDVALVQVLVEVLEPVAALAQPLHRKLGGIALAERRRRQAIEMGAVPADLDDLRFGILDKAHVPRLAIPGEMGDHAFELDPFRRVGTHAQRKEQQADYRDEASHDEPLERPWGTLHIVPGREREGAR